MLKQMVELLKNIEKNEKFPFLNRPTHIYISLVLGQPIIECKVESKFQVKFMESTNIPMPE